jgi:phosphoserine aminotransferase
LKGIQMSRKHNFYAGPAVLPVSAVNKALENLLNYNGSGIGMIEMSHRSKDFDEIIGSAKERAKRLYNIPEGYEILFIPGGASMTMAMNALNFIKEGEVAQVVDTGTWSKRQIKEIDRSLGKCDVIWSGKDSGYSVLPNVDELKFADDAAFAHITSNNTIAGTQFRSFPTTKAPLFVDMSSDFFSKPVNISQFDMIYGGAQKNIGPSGCAFVIIKKELVERCPDHLSEMLDFRNYVKKNSMYNTPPTFSIYMISLVLEWLEKDIGGLENMDKINKEKAAVLYDTFDSSDGYYNALVKNPEHRSLMNVTFNLSNSQLEAKLIGEATEAGLIGLKGHRSVGGLRASIYNSCPLESVKALSLFLKEFAAKNI